MLAAIKEMAEKNSSNSDTCTAEYLQACNMMFENGILSHQKIQSTSSTTLSNIEEGFKWFKNWKHGLQSEPGWYHN